MNSLVGYGSSSEDEDGEVSRPEPEPSGLANQDKPAANGISSNISTLIPEASDNAAEGPMVGPARPLETNSETQYTEEDDETLDLSSMTEREALRYLTQPTNPLTSFPTSPPGSPDAATNARFKRFLELKAKGVHFNEDLARKSTFQNPNLLSTLMERAGIRGEMQYRNTLPKDIFSLDSFPAHAFKEELLKSQQAIQSQLDTQKKADAATSKRTIEFTSGGQSGVSSRNSTPGAHRTRKGP